MRKVFVFSLITGGGEVAGPEGGFGEGELLCWCTFLDI